jgi:hypothetical protein
MTRVKNVNAANYAFLKEKRSRVKPRERQNYFLPQLLISNL